MTKQEQVHAAITLSISKLLSEQSTYLINVLPKNKNIRFNETLKKLDKFIDVMEKDLSKFDKKTLEILTDSMHDGIANLRKELILSLEKK